MLKINLLTILVPICALMYYVISISIPAIKDINFDENRVHLDSLFLVEVMAIAVVTTLAIAGICVFM